MEIAIVVAGAIGLIGMLKGLVTLAIFEDHRHRSKYNHEEERHKRIHDSRMHEDPRYFI